MSSGCFIQKCQNTELCTVTWKERRLSLSIYGTFFYSSKVSEANAQLQSVVLTMCQELNRELSDYIMNAA